MNAQVKVGSIFVLMAGILAVAMVATPPPARASSCSVTSPACITCRTYGDGSSDTSSWFEISAVGRTTNLVNHTIVLSGNSTLTVNITGQEGDCSSSVSCGASCSCVGDSCSCEGNESLGVVFCEWWVLNNGTWELDGYFEEC